MDDEVKGPDPEVWGEPTQAPAEDEAEVPEDLKGPDETQWNDDRPQEDQTGFAAAYEAEVNGTVINKGPDPDVWS